MPRRKATAVAQANLPTPAERISSITEALQLVGMEIVSINAELYFGSEKVESKFSIFSQSPAKSFTPENPEVYNEPELFEDTLTES